MDELELCTFHVERLFLGVEVRCVQEVLRHQTITRVPLVSPVVRGLINLRGQVVTTIDMRRRLELPDFPDESLSCNVVLCTDDGLVSLLVDEIGDVVTVPGGAFEPAPQTVRGIARKLTRGVYKLRDRLMLVLDIDRAIDDESD